MHPATQMGLVPVNASLTPKLPDGFERNVLADVHGCLFLGCRHHALSSFSFRRLRRMTVVFIEVVGFLPGMKLALAKFPASISVVVCGGKPGGRALAAVASTVLMSFNCSASLSAS